MTATLDSLSGHLTCGDHVCLATEGPVSVPADHPAPDHHRAAVGGDGLNSASATSDSVPITTTLAQPNLRDDHPRCGGQEANVVAAPTPAQTNGVTSPMGPPPAQAPFPPAPAVSDTATIEQAPVPAGSPQALEQAIGGATPNLGPPAQGSTPPAPATPETAPISLSPVLADPLLALAADVLDDLEKVRIANENRLRQLTRDETDVDGEERGFGLTLDHPDVKRTAALVDALVKAEHDAALNLQRLMRQHPLGPWVKQAKGVGEKQAARLLATIGDPYWNDLHGRPRTVSELWAYSGYHVLPAGHVRIDTHSRSDSGVQAGGNPDPDQFVAQESYVGVAAVRARGTKANWSADAKMRGHLVVASIVKQLRAPCARPEGQPWAEHVTGCACSPYRVLYDEARQKYAGSLHPAECKRCGPKGDPALIGSPRSPGHQEAMAYRVVVKAVLRDLWREAKRLHEDAAA